MRNPSKAPMGWNSWDCYGAAVTEETVRKNAEFMAKNLKQYGWEYVVVDIQWYEPSATTHDYHPFAEICMDEYSRAIPAENRFPSSKDGKGFKPLADYVHSLGLKFGIHIMRGIPRQAVHQNTKILGTDKTARDIAKTSSICHWNTDMYGVDPQRQGAKEYYESLFALYKSWDVDFIKCDDICREMPHEENELILLSDSLKNCGRDMILSLSPGPALLEKSELYKQTANMWRITDDFWDNWELLYAMFERCEKWSVHTGANHFPDADMLPIGAIKQDYHPDIVTNFTKDEQITMLTLWSIFRSPLMIGGEMTKFDDFTMSLITNENILSMHTNSRHAHQVFRKYFGENEIILWQSICATGGEYVAIFNAGDTQQNVEIGLCKLEIYNVVSALNLWNNEKFEIAEKITAKIPPHGAIALKLD